MLYHVTLTTDRQAIAAAGDAIQQVAREEAARVAAVKREGRLMGLWRRGDGFGSVFVVDAASHQQLADELATIPLAPFLRQIDIAPLLPHPFFPEYGEVRVAEDTSA